MELMTLKYKYNSKLIFKTISENDDTIIISHDPDSGNVYEFNDIGSYIFLLVTKSMPINQIVDTLLNKYDITYEEIKEDLVFLFERFLELGIITLDEE